MVAVDKILEPVADAVSQLVIFCAEAEATGAAMPDLRPLATQVSGATATLVKVSNNMAQGSKDMQLKEALPIAAKKIEDHTQGLAAASESLFSASDNVTSRNKLVDACQGILNAMTELLTATDDAEVRMVLKGCSDSATSCKRLDDVADIIHLTPLANDVTAMMNRVVKRVEPRIEEMVHTGLKSRLATALDTYKATIPLLISATKVKMENPGLPSAAQSYQFLVADLSAALREIIEVVQIKTKKERHAVVAMDPGTECDIAKRIHGHARDMYRAAINGDAAGVAAVAPMLVHDVKGIRDDCRQIAAQIEAENPELAAELNAACDNLDRLLPDLLECAKALLADPDNPELQKRYKEIQSQLEQNVRVLEAGRLKALLFTAHQLLEKVPKDVSVTITAASKADQGNFVGGAKELGGDNGELCTVSNRIAELSSDAEQKQTINGCTERMDHKLPRLINASKTVLLAPANASGKEHMVQVTRSYLDDIKKLGDALTFDRSPDELRKELVDSVLVLLEKLLQECADGKVEESKTLSVAIHKKCGELANTIRVQAYQLDDTERQAATLKQCDIIESLAPKTESVATPSASAPDDQGKRAVLYTHVQDLRNAIMNADAGVSGGEMLDTLALARRDAGLDTLAGKSLLSKIATACANGNEALANALLIQANDRYRHLIKLCQEEAARVDDDKKKKYLLDACDTMEGLLGELEAATRAAVKNPKDQALLDTLMEVSERVDAHAKIMEAMLKGDYSHFVTEEIVESVDQTLADNRVMAAATTAEENSALLAQLNRDAEELEQGKADIREAAAALRSNPENAVLQSNFDDQADKLQAVQVRAEDNMQEARRTEAARLLDQTPYVARKAKGGAAEGDAIVCDDNLETLQANVEALDLVSKEVAARTQDAEQKASIEDAAGKVAATSPKLHAADKALLANPDSAAAQKEAADLTEQLQAELAELNKAMCLPATAEQRQAESSKSAVAALEAVPPPCKAGNAVLADEKVGEANTELAKFVADTREAAKNISDPADQQRVLAHCDAVETRAPTLAAQAQKAAADPGNAEEQAKLDALVSQLTNAVKCAVAATKGDPDPTPEGQAEALTLEGARKLQRLNAAVKAGDVVRTTEVLDAIIADNNKLAELTRAAAATEDDPKKKAWLMQAADELDQRTEQLKAAAVKAAENPGDPALLDALLVAQEESTAAGATCEAALNGDFSKFIAEEAISDVDKKVAAGRDIADEVRTVVPEEAAEVDAQIQRVDDLKPALLAAVKQRQADPSDAVAAKNFETLCERLQNEGNMVDTTAQKAREAYAQKLLAEVPAAVAKASAAAEKGDAAGAATAMDDVKAKADALTKVARAIAEEKDDGQKVPIEDAAAKLEVLETPLRTANAARATDATKADDEDKAAKEYNQAVYALGDALNLEKTPEQQQFELTREAETLLDRTAAAAHAGDVAEASTLAPKTKSTVDDLVKVARGRAAEDPSKQEAVLAQCDALDALSPALESAAQRAAENPDDEDAQNDMDKLVTAMKGAITGIEKGAAPSDLEKAAAITAGGNRLLANLVAAAKMGNCEEALKFAVDNYQRLIELVEAAAAEEGDPQQKAWLNQSADEMRALLDELAEKSRALAADPTNAELVAALEDVVARTQAQADKMEAALQGDFSAFVANELGQEIDKTVAAARSTAATVEAEDSALAAELRKQADELEASKAALADAVRKLQRNPSDPTLKSNFDELVHKTRTAQEALDAKVDQALADNAERLMADAANARRAAAAAAAKGDQAGAAEALKQVDAATKKLAAVSNTVAAKDESKAADIAKAVADLEKDTDTFSSAVTAAAANPADRKLLGDMRDAAKAAQDDSDALAKALNVEKPPAAQMSDLVLNAEVIMDMLVAACKDGDVPAATALAKDGEQVTLDLAAAARQVAETEEDPSKKAAILAQANALDTLAPALQDTALHAAQNPEDKDAQERLKKLTDQIKAAARGVTDGTPPTLEDEIAVANCAAGGLFEQLKDACKQGDVGKKDETMDKIKGQYKGLLGNAVKATNKMDDPVQKQVILDASADAQGKLDELEKAAAEAAADPSNAEKQERVNALSKDVQDLGELIERAVHGDFEIPLPPPEEEESSDEDIEFSQDPLMAAAQAVGAEAGKWDSEGNKLVALANEISDLMAQLALASETGDKKALIEAARAIVKKVNGIHKLAAEVAADCTDPRLKKTLETVSSTIPTIAVQLKVVAAVKASTRDDDPTAAEQLVTCAQNLSRSVVDTVSSAQSASIKSSKSNALRWKRKKRSKRTWG